MNTVFGIYEQLISQALAQKIQSYEGRFYLSSVPIPSDQAIDLLTQYAAKVLHYCLGQYKGEKALAKQIELVNGLIQYLDNEFEKEELSADLLQQEGLLLKAILSRLGKSDPQLKEFIKTNYSLTGYSFSNLFTGANSDISLDSELRKEIVTADTIYWIVSFIRWTGVRIFEKELRAFTKRQNTEFRVICTTYMGASEAKAIEYLASLPNTKVKISYDTHHERLHAKSYIFKRNSGYHTAYIGSSNLSYAALTKGLEWNMKVNAQENPHIVQKATSTFNTYWENKNFELYEAGHSEKLRKALLVAKGGKKQMDQVFILPGFEITPYPYQQEILEKLLLEREALGNYKNLVVAATGTGKTVIAAFDFKQFQVDNKNAKILFVAHREEILIQALSKFKGVLRDANFGALWVGKNKPKDNYDELFISVQTLYNQRKFFEERFKADYYDYIVVDEAHHGAANSYQFIFDFFKPKILLGLTATPERMDGKSLLPYFNDKIAASIRLPDALKSGLLSPFQYFCVTDHDSVDLTSVPWKGKYDAKELDNLYTGNHHRVSLIADRLEHYCTDLNKVKAVGFCNSVDHARFMSDAFNKRGLKSTYLVSGKGITTTDRQQIKKELSAGKVNYVFVRDIYNEGVDIPSINTVLFLRPTESLTIFLQQLGRGLRLDEGKECLTVLDFVGQAHQNYHFTERKFRAVLGRNTATLQKEIDEGFPHVPFGSSITMEEKAREFILQNINEAVYNARRIQSLLKDMIAQGSKPSLFDFLTRHDLDIRELYKGNNSWIQHLQKINQAALSEDKKYTQLTKSSKRLLHINSKKYLNWIQSFMHYKTNAEATGFALMFYYDLWQKPLADYKFKSIQEALNYVRNTSIFRKEILDIVQWMTLNINQKTAEIKLDYEMPLELHAKYSRDQILAAFGKHTVDKKYSSREGVLKIKEKNTELLFVTLDKSEGAFSPTTNYEDYAISEKIFHWQSQNSAKPESGAGLSYINHKSEEKQILLFVREKTKDRYKMTMPFHFLGPVNYIRHSGAKPMSIQWEMQHNLPAFLWEQAAKLAHG